MWLGVVSGWQAADSGIITPFGHRRRPNSAPAVGLHAFANRAHVPGKFWANTEQQFIQRNISRPAK